MVACPFEPKYLMPESKLAEHLIKCPKAAHDNKSKGKKWYCEGINVINKDKNELSVGEEWKAYDFSMKDKVIEKIEAVYSQLKDIT